jgi:hypothetical protein
MDDQDQGILAKMKRIMETMPELAQMDPETLYEILKKAINNVVGVKL